MSDVKILNLPVSPLVVVIPEKPKLSGIYLHVACELGWNHADRMRAVLLRLAWPNEYTAAEEIQRARTVQARNERLSDSQVKLLEAADAAEAVERYVRATSDARRAVADLQRLGVPVVLKSEEEITFEALDTARTQLAVPRAQELAKILE